MSYPVKQQIRDIAPYGVKPYQQNHAHSTGNKGSTAQDEANYMSRKDLNSGYFTEVVGNGGVIETAYRGRGAWDVGNSYNFETYSGIELIESHKTKEDFLIDYAIYVDRLRKHADESNTPKTLDTADLAGIKTHEWCTINANTYGGHIDPYPYLNSWGITRDRFRKDIEKGMTTERVETYENPVKGSVDTVNLNSLAFLVEGWLLHKKNDLKNTTPWLFFVDDNNKEIFRVKGVWVSRPDVAKVFKNPQGANVGVKFTGVTPKELNQGKKYRIMFRASDDKTGNTSYAENWFDSNFDQAPKVDTGSLDLFKLQDGKLRIAGWHLATTQKQNDRHFIIIMNREDNKELTRFDITQGSYNASNDVKDVFKDGKVAQSAKCRFDALVDVENVLKNKSVYVMSRYCTDAKGNNGVNGQYSFKDTVIFI